MSSRRHDGGSDGNGEVGGVVERVEVVQRGEASEASGVGEASEASGVGETGCGGTGGTRRKLKQPRSESSRKTQSWRSSVG